MSILKSERLRHVGDDVHGPVLEEAARMEAQGYRLSWLHIGDPAAFGFAPPPEMLHEMAIHLAAGVGYCDSKGLMSARQAIARTCHDKGMSGIEPGDIYIGNGVSELIVMALQALLEDGDEVLVPMPDYPLWTSAVTLCGGRPVYYRCDETAGWLPDLASLEAAIGPRTRALVVINPNNPTGAVYPPMVLAQLAAIAEWHGLVLLADEILDGVLFDETVHVVPLASLAPGSLCLTFNGLSKTCRAPGLRSGWLVVSGRKQEAAGYIDGLDMLASMRLCANVPAQFAIPTALRDTEGMQALTRPGGRLREQRDLAWDLVTGIPGVSCVKPQAGFYLFPRLHPGRYPLVDDRQLVLDLLRAEKLLLVQGSAFQWPQPDHLRLVFLPHRDELLESISRLCRFLGAYRKRHNTHFRYLV